MSILSSVDYSTIELATLSQNNYWLQGYSLMGDAINAGKDLHMDFGSGLMGMAYEPALELYEAKDKFAKDMRQASKCFHPDTEVLTPEGWKRIADIQPADVVMAAQPIDEPGGEGRVVLHWERPTQVTRRACPDGELVHLYCEGIDLRVTRDHRMMVFRANGKHAVVRPEDMSKVRQWKNAGRLPDATTERMTASDERLLRLAVATQADGSYMNQRIRFGFSKQRKIDRLKSLLMPEEYRLAVYTNGKALKNTTMFTLTEELSAQVKPLLDNKKFSWKWLLLTEEMREVVLDEIQHWDGSKNTAWQMYQYSSTIRQNLDVVQALAVITGRKTRLMMEQQDVKNHNHLPCGRLTIRAKDHDHTRGENLETMTEKYDGDVVCLSVPSTFVMVRDGGVPVIVGQCVNFGLPGGLGAEALVAYAKANYNISLCVAVDHAEKCGIHKHVSKSKKSAGKLICSACVATAKRLKEEWFRKWPEMPGYFDIIKRLTDGPDGGRVQIPGPGTDVGVERGGCFFTEGANCKFQGLAARGGKKSVFNISKEAYCDRKSPLYGARLGVFVHDETLLDIPITDHTHEAAMRQAEVMIQTMKYFVPDVAIRAEPALQTRWLKNAEPSYDENGRLIPCAICPVCSGLGVVGWDGKFRTSAAHPGGKQRGHKTLKGEACNYDGPACPADLRTLGVA